MRAQVEQLTVCHELHHPTPQNTQRTLCCACANGSYHGFGYRILRVAQIRNSSPLSLKYLMPTIQFHILCLCLCTSRLQRDWLTLVAVHSDSWLLAVAFFYGVKLDSASRQVWAHIHLTFSDSVTVPDTVSVSEWANQCREFILKMLRMLREVTSPIQFSHT